MLCPTGQDTLRCLALATVEEPGRKEEMNLEDPENFVQYEVQLGVGTSCGCKALLPLLPSE